MPLTGNFASYCPLLLDSDKLSLSGRLHAENRRIYDSTIGALHCVEPQAAALLHELNGNGCLYARLRKIARNEGIDDLQLTSLLGFLNLTGGLLRRRNTAGWKEASVKLGLGLMTGVRYKPLYMRKPASATTILAQLVQASKPVLILGSAVAFLAAAGGVTSVTLAGSAFAMWTLLFLASTSLHEMTHYYLLGRYRVTADIIRHGLRCGLLHRQLSAKQEVKTALSGPAVGVSLCIACGTWGALADNILTVVICISIGIIHLLSLSPWYGDGASFKSGLHRLRYQ